MSWKIIYINIWLCLAGSSDFFLLFFRGGGLDIFISVAVGTLHFDKSLEVFQYLFTSYIVQSVIWLLTPLHKFLSLLLSILKILTDKGTLKLPGRTRLKNCQHDFFCLKLLICCLQGVFTNTWQLLPLLFG